MRFTEETDEEVPVLIVGGGGAGLTSSMLLARLGVDHLLVNARPQTSDLPKAHVLNQRAMEVLDDAGVAGAIAEQSTPPEQMAATAFYAGFAGPGPDYGRRLARLECWGARGEDDRWRAASPWRQLNLPQIRLEPLLKARAEELSPGRIRFGHELVDLGQDAEGVRATVRDNASGRRYTVRCQYLLGADGGRRVASLAGVEYEGLGVVTQTATLHVSADFSPWAPDPDVLIRWIFSPQAGVLVVMVPMGPQRWGPASEEWVIHLNYPVDDPWAQCERAGRSRRPPGAGRPGPADEDPQGHPLVGRGRDRLGVPGRPRAPAGGRGAPPPAHRRAGADQRDPRRAEPVLEARGRAGRSRVTGAA
jgi:2,4-dichlorophenol 6-monooxygenase